ncbi:MAG: cyclic pyranopterin monophosphate synthase MoaC [Bacteroidales bacterium]|nr:cyclic pyranopterin monophosphate synthase MoaC [Bacteroidales bacterium]
MKKLTHTDNSGRASMVDVGHKGIQKRRARATGHISLSAETLKLIAGNNLKKGDVLTVAQIAGINAAKMTSGLIPLCHNILLDYIRLDLKADSAGIVAESEVVTTGRTGAEMEALTSVAVALLTLYDMCKAVDRKMVIDNISLLEKIKE